MVAIDDSNRGAVNRAISNIRSEIDQTLAKIEGATKLLDDPGMAVLHGRIRRSVYGLNNYLVGLRRDLATLERAIRRGQISNDVLTRLIPPGGEYHTPRDVLEDNLRLLDELLQKRQRNDGHPL